ncbi:universal stress protein [Amycolatopsis keratiniphila]|uniref:Universal stress protein UspA n=1 Tax=Amycolatopsis keratiniphila subsp. keratiniphila TaxID=227715 RepID=A0A1W2M248_9PSEU|nr:universal stress protein [Amycolatopsis keratiniphila]ONF73606.1 universal stress protein UspA [Amycolatopsis keratiniphila subsp. keratiniphila]
MSSVEKAVAMASRRYPVVAGVDGSDSALQAVRWAAGDAVRRDLPLRLVYACVPPGHDYPNLEVTAAEVRDAMWETGAKRLRAATEAARTVASSLVVESEIRPGDPRVVLVDESRRAAVTVLGSRGLNGIGRLLLGSSGLAVAMRGHCPLVVVRGDRARSGPVLVGVDDWARSAAAVRFAFQEASALGASVTALKTWHDFGPVDGRSAAPAGPATRHEVLRRELEAEMSAVAAGFPEVSFDCLVVRGRPGRVLLEYGERAGLVVVGSRGRGAFGGLLLGSVGQNLTGHASYPVAVVRSEAGAETTGRQDEGRASVRSGRETTLEGVSADRGERR